MNLCRFFQHYAPFLPGLLDPDTPWTSYHQRSPFLFWTIICTGARHFPDLGFFQSVSSKVRTLTGSSLLQVQDPIPTIQASLILCLWPLPLDTMWKDPSHALAGAAMQLAIQNGLHAFRHEQDFRRDPIDSNDRMRVFRVQVWLHCVIVFQR
jgi:transcriptional regulatory protein LEU3